VTGRALGDAGTGTVSTLAGVTAFLVLLLFAVQVMLNLYATSVLSAAAYDAARRAATHGREPTALEQADAESYARSLLGAYGARAQFDWSASDDSVVRLRVRLANARLLPLVGLVGLDEVDRTFSVRVEEPR
jgi:Flp pilus assembly protein TadG